MPMLRGPSFALFGARITLHVSWVVVFPVLVAVLTLTRLPAAVPGVDPAVAWAAGLGGATLALVVAVVHEAAHAAAARMRRIPYGPSILYFFGGVDASDRPLSGAVDETVIAVAGPLVSAAVAAALVAIAAASAPATGMAADALREALVVGAGFSALIGLANLLPGDPLDGGRIVHGIAWRLTGDPLRARRTTARVGRGVGLLLVGAGFAVAIAGDVADSVVLILAGWFVRTGAVAAERRATLRDLVGDLRVSDAMDRAPAEIAQTLTLDTFAPQALETGEQDAFAVARDGDVVGVLGLRTIRRLKRDAWERTRAGDAMTALADLRAFAPDDALWPALEELNRSGRDALPVLHDGSFVGLLSRLSVARKVNERARLARRPR